MALLEVEDLHVGFPVENGTIELVRGLSFTVEAGEAVGLVGESGSGKSQTALAILHLLRPPVRILKGAIRFDGQDLATADERTMRHIRGGAISMVFQDALSGLNPAFTIGTQLTNVITAHRRVGRAEARTIAIEALGMVGIREPESRLGQYPHQFSGGMRQRVLIAMAIACRPKLLIADEPTTALDVTVQAQIVELLADLRDRLGLALLFITHNLDLMSQLCRRAVVLYGGMLMEEAPVADLFGAPRQPYTRALLACVPRLTDTPGAINSIEGSPPVAGRLGPGCPFAPRCTLKIEQCAARPPERVKDAHRIACWRAEA
jgi:oligopeptide/dipeptide ABC transporter ATP-binding protein